MRAGCQPDAADASTKCNCLLPTPKSMTCLRRRLAAALALIIALNLQLVACAAFGIQSRSSEKRSSSSPLQNVVVMDDGSGRSAAGAAAAVVFSSTLLIPSLAHASGDAVRGSEIFNANCASCHAGGINVIKEKRTLQKDALEQFVGGYDTETIQTFLKESSRHQNQAYFRAPGGKLSATDFGDAASYVSQTAATNAW